MSEQVYEKQVVKAAEMLGVDPSDLANYVTAWYFLELHTQGKFPLKPEDKAKLENIVEKLKPIIEPAIQKVKGEQLVQVKATFWLPKRVVQLIKDEDYFSYGEERKNEFYADGVRCLLSCILSEKPITEVTELEKKYGLKPDDTATEA